MFYIVLNVPIIITMRAFVLESNYYSDAILLKPSSTVRSDLLTAV